MTLFTKKPQISSSSALSLLNNHEAIGTQPYGIGFAHGALNKYLRAYPDVHYAVRHSFRVASTKEQQVKRKLRWRYLKTEDDARTVAEPEREIDNDIVLSLTWKIMVKLHRMKLSLDAQ